MSDEETLEKFSVTFEEPVNLQSADAKLEAIVEIMGAAIDQFDLGIIGAVVEREGDGAFLCGMPRFSAITRYPGDHISSMKSAEYELLTQAELLVLYQATVAQFNTLVDGLESYKNIVGTMHQCLEQVSSDMKEYLPEVRMREIDVVLGEDEEELKPKVTH